MGGRLVRHPIRKAPLTLRISVTDRCQLRCQYCMPAEGVSSCSHEDVLSFEQVVDFVRLLQESFDVRKIRLTGGDPLARKGVVDLVAMISSLGVPELAMTTNAQLLAGMATQLRDSGLNRLNISLDSLNPDTFRHITRGGHLQRTLDGIDAVLQTDMRPVKLNMVVLQGINDLEVGDVLSYAIDRGCELRFLELMPIGHGAGLFDGAFVSAESVRQRLASRFGMTPLPAEPGSSARRYRVSTEDGFEGVVGFIAPCSDPFCSGCTRLRLTADGHLIGCLGRGEGVDIRTVLRHGSVNGMAAVCRQSLQRKRTSHHFQQSAAMATIGG